MSLQREIEDRAALWVLQREEPSWSNADQEEFDHWLAQSDAHKVAFWRLEHGWREADRIASLGLKFNPAPKRMHQLAWQMPVALAASLLLMISLFLVQWPGAFMGTPPQTRMQFETPIGGHRIVSLPDGSRVELNTDTAIKAVVDGRSRAVWLERGEAFFEIAKQHGRKFVIYAGARTVTVLGTKFSVRRDPGQIVVAVLEGRVSVDASALPGRHATVTAGDVAIASGRNTLITKSDDAVQQQLAWRNGRLMFDDVTLAAAAEQFNRYNQRSLVVADADAGRVFVSGNFLARDVDGFTELLKNTYGVTADEHGGKILLSGRRMADRGSVNLPRPFLIPARPKSAVIENQCGYGDRECSQLPFSSTAPKYDTSTTAQEQAVRQAENWEVLHSLYPPRALAAREEGMVGFTVSIDGIGNAASCKITHTSGHPLLDLETCELIMVHAVFKRNDGVSRSQLRSYEGVVNWRLPPTTVALRSPVSQPLAVGTAPEEVICKKIQKADSNVAFERKCLTKSEWQRADDETRNTLEQLRGDRAH